MNNVFASDSNAWRGMPEGVSISGLLEYRPECPERFHNGQVQVVLLGGAQVRMPKLFFRDVR